MRIAITANGPGEVAGWVRPLLRELYARAPETDVHVFLVPDDYATGSEAQMVLSHFPQAHAYDPRTYVGVALGRSAPGLPKSMDIVHYSGGDLMHAGRLHKRFGGAATTYKFSRPKYREVFQRAFAVDNKNVAELEKTGLASERIECVGNLVIDGAFLESQATLEAGAPEDGLLIMPGSRRHEVESGLPFFFTAALRLRRERPEIPIAFGISPFTSLDQLRAAIEGGGVPAMWAEKGQLIAGNEGVFLASLDGAVRFPILHSALAAAKRARIALTLPGTKCIELAALGVPTVAVTPYNAPEKVVVNGPLTYVDRIPLFGVPLKRAVALAVAKRFKYHTQPNIDLDEMVIREVHSTLSPGRLARIAIEAFDDRAWQRASGPRLAELYSGHVGASGRMAESLLGLAK